MTLKKAFAVIGTWCGLGLAGQVYAQFPIAPSPQINPFQAEFLDAQKVEFSIGLPDGLQLAMLATEANPNSPYRLKANINGIDASKWINDCVQQYALPEAGRNYLVCKNEGKSAFTAGANILEVSITRYDETWFSSQAFYYVFNSKRIYRNLPHNLILPGNHINKSADVYVTQGQRVLITATGKVSVWPSNITFPLSTPRGTTTTCGLVYCTLPGAPLGALLVKIGSDGIWNVAGENRLLTADRAGELFFAINDKTTLPELNDNTGSYQISLRPY